MLNIERLIRPENNIFHTIKSYNNLPHRNDRKQTKTSWVDQVDIRYTYDVEKKDTLVICSPLGFYPDSIMDYINNSYKHNEYSTGCFTQGKLSSYVNIKLKIETL